jgi:large subunit ribosomal protein L22
MSTPEVKEVRAAAKWVRITPRKARLVVEHIRGRTVPEARTMLAFTDRAAAREIDKLLRSAVANAEANHNLVGDDLVVKTAYVDEGPTIKRWRARARGRAARIRKRMCHITITLGPAATATVTRAPETEAPAQEKPAAKRPVRGAKGTADQGKGSRGNREVSPATKKQPRRKKAAQEKPEAKAESKPKTTRKKKEESDS